MCSAIQYKELVFTVKDRCRVCYTCVRECPVKAIKIDDGQAEVISERCIGCGNCVKVCSQGAKEYIRLTDEVTGLLKSSFKVAACIAPSFPAEFSDIKDYRVLIGMIRFLGFDYVSEVAFGADLVAKEYKKILDNKDSKPSISSDCPAVVYYIEQYYPELVDSLAPIVSPMVAIKRVMHKKYGDDLKVVFIGPCVAKKAESREIDAVITFVELRELFREAGITSEMVEAADFDPPFAGKGSVFPISRGLLHNMDVSEDISDGNVLVADGRVHFREVISELENDLIKSKHLELLCCEGCIMGPGMSSNGKRFLRRAIIGKYVSEKLDNLDEIEWAHNINEFKEIDLSKEFEKKDRRLKKPSEYEINKVLKSIGKFEAKDHLNCGACGYDTCYEHAMAIVQGLAEDEMCLPYSIEKLHKSISELNDSNEALASAKQALVQSEKLASMGQLSAGIAHELNNPLGVITMYSNLLKDETRDGDPMQDDLNLIVEQADRCKKIVGGLLNFARQNQVKLTENNIELFTKQSIASIIKPDNIDILFESSLKDPFAWIDADQMMQVLTNLEKNAVEAMPDGGEIKIQLLGDIGQVEIYISDTGTGISDENMEKIFTPFFTTKELGKGTGLGLPLIYGIVKMHKGQISVVSNADNTKGKTGTTFKIVIPRKSIELFKK